MDLRTRPREDPEINLTSLIDVVLLLLVFFMVSTSFLKATEVRLQLPQAEALPREEPAREIEIIVTASGDYFVDGQELVNRRPETLQRALQRVAGEGRELPVTIRADARASHQSVVTAMDIVGRLGFREILIATVSEPE
ncbi:biopolymer transporter ExbD [Thioalkalivibrio sp. XN279]|uniref:ExbD/TolR family protein n=1 Tax=Thioalkalivibrio sp. XN279 TaxID=2714953 RepID=UPI001407B658|nr:biopolymer transporter ExbD [Thioalkalivibrio sp. XN279]NHA14286.1 biopolymer transporter ExbD [Thioalkalivibrio sp. XN279]